MSDTTIIEVNGIKMEVDLRTAKKVDHYRVGDPIKVLIKEYDEYIVYSGVIAGFEAFEQRPTIIVAYIKTGYDGGLRFKYIHADSKDVEITTSDDNYMPIEKADVLEKMDTEIEKKQSEVKDLQQKKAYFIDRFQRYFED